MAGTFGPVTPTTNDAWHEQRLVSFQWVDQVSLDDDAVGDLLLQTSGAGGLLPDRYRFEFITIVIDGITTKTAVPHTSVAVLLALRSNTGSGTVINTVIRLHQVILDDVDALYAGTLFRPFGTLVIQEQDHFAIECTIPHLEEDATPTQAFRATALVRDFER